MTASRAAEGQGDVVLRADALARRLGRGDGAFALAIDVLELRAGETTAILGPNGSGKSTLLRALAGVDRLPGEGTIALVRGRATLVSQRPVAFAGSVAHNVGVGLLGQGIPASERRARSERALERFGIAGLARHDARTLSGGELRRLALARALAVEPSVLLLDEPFDDLDAEGQRGLSLDLLATVHDAKIALVVVTHDLHRALLLADRLVVLAQGRIAQQGTRDAVLRHPDSPEVARIVGMTNLVTGRVVGAGAAAGQIELPSGRIVSTASRVAAGEPVWLGIRPEDLKIDVGRGEGLPLGRAVVTSMLDDGLATVVRLELDDARFTTHLLSGRGLARRLRIGDTVELAVAPEHVHARPLARAPTAGESSCASRTSTRPDKRS